MEHFFLSWFPPWRRSIFYSCQFGRHIRVNMADTSLDGSRRCPGRLTNGASLIASGGLVRLYCAANAMEAYGLPHGALKSAGPSRHAGAPTVGVPAQVAIEKALALKLAPFVDVTEARNAPDLGTPAPAPVSCPECVFLRLSGCRKGNIANISPRCKPSENQLVSPTRHTLCDAPT